MKQLKSVLIGGIPGLLIGSTGELLANDVLIPEDVETEGDSVEEAEVYVPEAEEGQSFGEAFAEARAELGPGGVFEWNGGLYSTYYAEEWASLDAEQREEYFQWALNGIEPDSESDIQDDIDDDDNNYDVIYGPPPADDDDVNVEDPVYEDVYGPPDWYDTLVDNMD